MNRLVAIAAVLVGTAGCASTVTGSGTVGSGPAGAPVTSGGPSGSPPASASASAPPPVSVSPPAPSTPHGLPDGEWQRVADGPTGFSFRLPSNPRVERRSETTPDGVRLKARQYTAFAIGENFDASVTVEGSSANQLMTWNLDALPSSMRRRFDAAGAKDFAILEKRHLAVDGHAAISFRIRFTSLDGTGRRSVWLVCAVSTSRALVLVQTVGFASKPEESSVLVHERGVQRKMVASLDVGSA